MSLFIAFIIIAGIVVLFLVNLYDKINRLDGKINRLDHDYKRLEQRINVLARQNQEKTSAAAVETLSTVQPVPKPEPDTVGAPPVPPPVPETVTITQKPIAAQTANVFSAPPAPPAQAARIIAPPAAPPYSNPVRHVEKPAEPPQLNSLDRAAAAIKNWILGGNTMLRIGVVLLFIGLAFLLRYASEKFSFPVESRYIGVTLAAFALLALGWRLRRRRSSYGLMLQGTGIAVLYLTVFAAMRLHNLLSPEIAFVLLVLVTAASAVLAILQNALGLACAAALGGFAAPILVSTGSGNHIILFSYFALLNMGILLIAWFKAWRSLNLIGFIGTFSIGTAWGLRSYNPELFTGTEFFLILFFLMYIGIGLLFARRKLLEANDIPEGRIAALRQSLARTDYLDGTLIFGPPLVGFGLQCAVIGHLQYGKAFSSLALGLFYFGLAYCLSRKPALLLLTEVCLALSVVFGTLAIPLAFDARWTSAAWAAEGAGIYWLGLRQSRKTARIFSLMLMAVAAIVYLSEIHSNPGVTSPMLDGPPLGAAMLGVALLFSYLSLRRAPEGILSDLEKVCKPLLAASGLAFVYLVAPLCFGREYTVIAWAIAGLATILAGIRLQTRIFLLCAFVIQMASGWTYFLRKTGIPENAKPVLHIGFMTAASVALAALVSAWLLHRGKKQPEQSELFSIDFSQAAVIFSHLLLIRGLFWWMSAASDEISHFLNPEFFSHALLLTFSVSAALWMLWARREKWNALALACLLPLIAAIPFLLQDDRLLSPFGAFTWLTVFAAHFIIARYLAQILPGRILKGAHILGCWLILGALSRAARKFLIDLPETKNAWRWIGGALPSALYMLWAGSGNRLMERFWPIRDFSREYRTLAAVPVAFILAIWFWAGNLVGNGAADPIPWLPIINPLEAGLLLVLIAVYRWSMNRLPDMKIPVFRITLAARAAGGALLLALLTLSVCRTAHHWSNIPFQPDALLSSMGVQASWSIVWTAFALALMIGGARRGLRGVWITGAVLTGAVVVKLFLVELGDQGSLARIISFIAVGILLLIVGYFAPIPPQNPASQAPDKHQN